MTDKTTEELLKSQAEAVAKIQAEALATQMKMMESLYGNNPEMLAMMKSQMAAAMQNQSEYVAQAQSAALEALGQAQAGTFDPNAFVANMQSRAAAMGLDAGGASADDTEGFDAALGFIGQLQTDFTEREAVPLKAESPEARTFGYLLSGIVGTLNEHRLTELAPEPDTPEAHELVQGILENYWGIESTDDLGERFGELLEEGGHAALYAHYAELPFEALQQELEPEDLAGEALRWRFAQYAKDKISPESLRGWDIGRAASLARWGAFVGLIDAETAEAVLDACAREACERFHSWREFGVSYLTGGLFWRLNAGEDAAAEWLDDAGSACATLLDKDDGGAWQTHPWASEIAD